MTSSRSRCSCNVGLSPVGWWGARNDPNCSRDIHRTLRSVGGSDSTERARVRLAETHWPVDSCHCQNGVMSPRVVPGRPVHRVAVLLFDRPALFETAIACEVWGIDRTAAGVPRSELRLCTPERRTLTTDLGARIAVDHGLEALRWADTIVIPSAREAVRRPGGRTTPVVRSLRAAHRRGARIATFCSGAFVLAATGLLAGRKATTHWTYSDDVPRALPGGRARPERAVRRRRPAVHLGRYGCRHRPVSPSGAQRLGCRGGQHRRQADGRGAAPRWRTGAVRRGPGADQRRRRRRPAGGAAMGRGQPRSGRSTWTSWPGGRR